MEVSGVEWGLREWKTFSLPLDTAQSGAVLNIWKQPPSHRASVFCSLWNIPRSDRAAPPFWMAGPMLGFPGCLCIKNMNSALGSSSSRNNMGQRSNLCSQHWMCSKWAENRTTCESEPHQVPSAFMLICLVFLRSGTFAQTCNEPVFVTESLDRLTPIQRTHLPCRVLNCWLLIFDSRPSIFSKILAFW